MSDPTQQPPTDPYRPQAPYQPLPPYGSTPPPQGGPTGPGQPPFGQPPYGGPQYGQAQPMFAHAPKPNHPQATTSMVLGIISLVGGFMCLLPLLVAPAAWIMGGKAVKEIDASGGALGGRGEAQTGQITGIIGTVLLVLALLGIIAFISIIVIAASESGSSSDYEYYYDTMSTLLGLPR